MKTCTKITLCVFLLFHSIDSFSQSKLDDSKGELSKKSEKNSSNNQSSSSSSYTSSGGNILGELFGYVFIYTTYNLFIGDYKVENHLRNSITPYSYFDNRSGNYVSRDSDAFGEKKMRFDIEDKFLTTPLENIYGNHLKAKFRPFQYFYLQGDYFQLLEYYDLDQSHSNLSLFNFNFCYDRLRFERFNLGWTMGITYVGSGVNKGGLSVGFNTDIFLFKKVSLYSSIKWSSINDLPVNEIEIDCKYHVRKYYVSLGYERLKIAAPTYDFISVGGGIYF